MTRRTEFPQEAKFGFPWRAYQQRVLDEFDHHFVDDHLHVVAPPGSGKTLLGLEIARRLNQPTLILAPTSAIRDQWISRFCTFFLRTRETPNWISNTINSPEFLTVSTYQGLHAAFSKEQESSTGSTQNQLIHTLTEIGFNTLVLDEAHHLKNAWWKTVTEIKTAINPKVVGLTATPPYDSTALEWRKYSELNGPVDSEISIPELVKAGDLCPHQDFVVLSEPTEQENQLISNRRERVANAFESLKKDPSLIRAIESHPAWDKPLDHQEWIYTNISNYSAILIFLHAVHGETAEEKRKIIGDESFDIPNFDYFWAERLLHFYLFQEDPHFASQEEHQQELLNRLKHHGTVHRRQISFQADDKTQKLLSTSVSKLESIQKVVDFEYRQLKDRLRCVILSDYIRKEIYGSSGTEPGRIDQMGVVPIFELLRQQRVDAYRLGVLTGSLVIISRQAVSRLTLLSQQNESFRLSIKPFKIDDGYAEVSSNNHHMLVQLVTQLFEAGDIRVLIGTKSLLGEGWDAPSINALVLASFVGSFVLSNQMRGRAIRTQRGNDTKTANIWHLACYNRDLPFGGPDYDKIKRRFRTFVGVSYDKGNQIENGLSRMLLPDQIQTGEEVDLQNDVTFQEAEKRSALKTNWNRAIDQGTKMVKQIKSPYKGPGTYKEMQRVYMGKSVQNASVVGVALIAFLAFQSTQVLNQLVNVPALRDDLGIILIAFLLIAISLYFGGLAVQSYRSYLTYENITRTTKTIGTALLNTLVNLELISTPKHHMIVATEKDQFGSVYCHLEGASMYEKSIFSDCLSELLGPVDNPKYIIVQENEKALFTKREHYPIPEVISKNAKQAKVLEHYWKQHVGDCTLVYTRNIEGRKILVKSRIATLTTQFENSVEEISSWTK